MGYLKRCPFLENITGNNVIVTKCVDNFCMRLNSLFSQECSWLLGHLTSQLGQHRYDTTLLSLLWKVMDILIVCLQFWMLSNDSSSLQYVRFFAFFCLQNTLFYFDKLHSTLIIAASMYGMQLVSSIYPISNCYETKQPVMPLQFAKPPL